ncbi:MAG: branched-chain amino acid ABC transporter permease, partial [Desulfobacterales bacterium]|nr:branched-chain amino acid ABC transporter permease [Desulfobacterales bacterium]
MLFELIVRGAAIGLVYALMGAGLALLNGVMRIINFAHGDFYMIGGYVAYFSMVMAGLPFFLAIPLAMIAAFIIGALVEKLLLSPIHTKNIEKPMDYALIMTFAVLLLLRKLAALVFGPFYRKPPDYITTDIHIWGVKLSGGLVLSGAASLFLILGMVWFLKYTWRGRSWRAITQ